MSIRLITTCLALLSLTLFTSCGDDEGDPTLFSKADAAKYLEAWVKNVMDGNVAALQKDSAIPFRFRSRSWTSEAAFKKNIVGQTAELKAALERANAEGGTIDYYSYQDLEAGRWPERATVPEEDRPAQMARLGIRPEGYVAWVHVGRRSVARFILNAPKDRDRLVVQGIDPR